MLQKTLRAAGAAAMAVVLAASVVNVSAAVANELRNEECSGGVWVNFCWAEVERGTLLEMKGEIPFTGKSESFKVKLKGTIGGTAIEIACNGVAPANEGAITEEGLFLQPNPLSEDALVDTKIKFRGCEVQGALGLKCAVTSEFTTKELNGTPSFLELGDIPLAAAVGATIAEITFTNRGQCPSAILGTKKITGTQLFTLDEPGVDIEVHRLDAAPKSELLLAENAAELELELSLTLPEEKFWDLSRET